MTVYGYCKSDPDIPIGELDYGFIEKCEDINKLQKILAILRSGEEGKYPDLEQFTETQLAKKNPENPMLEKLNKEKRLQDMPKDEVKKTIDELKDMLSMPVMKSAENGCSDSNLPPIRNSGTEYIKRKDPEVVPKVSNKPRNPIPQSPEYWENLNKQVENEDGGDFENICKEKSTSTHLNDTQTKPAYELLTKQKLSSDISQEDRSASATNEKNKGNEAFRCGDFKEALIYYNRSLDILPTAASYNNKAITLIKLESFKEALDACEMVISLEPNNIKARMRRGIANKSLDQLEKAAEDFTKVTELEPTNKRGKELLEQVSKELEKRNATRKKKGHRLKIEEVNTCLPATNGVHSDEIIDTDKCKESSMEENVQVSEVAMDSGVDSKHNEKNEQCKVDSETASDVQEDIKTANDVPEDIKTASDVHEGIKTASDAPEHIKTASDVQEDIKTASDVQEVPVNSNVENTMSENDNDNVTKSSFIEKCENEVIENDEKCSVEYKDNEKENDAAEKNNGKSVHNSEPVGTQNDELSTTINKDNTEVVNCTEESSVVDVKENILKEVVVKELPVNVINMKDKGNELFRTGRYDKACEMYTSCINELIEVKNGYEGSLATLYSNRASCQTRTGNSKQCISDCNHSLKLSQSAKVYLKRARAYESSEKYLNAYVDYQNVHKMDSSSVNALQCCSRLGSVLRTQYGSTWREKLPKSDLILLDRSSFNNTFKDIDKEETPSKTLEALDDQRLKISTDDNNQVEACEKREPAVKDDAQVHKQPETGSVPNAKNTSAPPMKDPQPCNNDNKDKRGFGDKKMTKEKLAKEGKVLGFYDTKEKGNVCVQQGKYEEAIQCYTKCVEFLPKEVSSYTNRALCYLKLNQPEKVIEDCSFALKIQPSCIKALFRRAQAKKMLKTYKEALADLNQVLKLEPNNNAAKKEMDLCKSEFTAALRSIQAENEAAKLRDSKSKGKKVAIEEITSESAEFSVKGKMSTKLGKCPLAKESTSRNAQSKKMTGFEFLHAWNNVKSKKTAEYAELLMQIDPTKLVDLLSNKLDGEILKNFIHTINEHFTSKDTFRRGVQLLKSLCKASRFVTMLMFLNTTEKALLRSTIESLETRAKQTSEKALISDINSLRVSYQCS